MTRERRFNAYSTDAPSAQALIAGSLLDLIVSSATAIGPDVRIAFLKRSLFVCVPNVRLLPQVTLLSPPMTPEQAAGQLARLVAVAEAFAKALANASGAQSLPLVT